MAQTTMTVPFEPSSLASGVPSPDSSAPVAKSVDELSEYRKIVQFRDSVLSGQHPRIKVPASSVGRTSAAFPSQPSAQRAPGRGAQLPSSQLQSQGMNGHLGQQVARSGGTNSTDPITVADSGSSKAVPISARNEFNPVLLEKSAGLRRAELHLQRQRLEKSLKEQLEQRRTSNKNTVQQSESLQDFDLSDIFAKALTVVQATAPPVLADIDQPTNSAASSDSFDDNTFYSSQHESPDPIPSTQAPPEAPRDVQMLDAGASPQDDADAYSPTQNFVAPPLPQPLAQLPYQQSARDAVPVPARNPTGYPSQPILPPGLNLSLQQGGASYGPHSYIGSHPGLPGQPHGGHPQEPQVISSEDGATSRSGDSGNTDSDQATDQRRMQNSHHHALPSDLRRQASPFIRAHNLSPYAPQPAHVSSLATDRHPSGPEPLISVLPGVPGAPAPVAALRQEHGVVTSPESSPQGDKGGKKKNKKNRRKKANQVAQSPEIKAEPRSPSPFSPAQFGRPQKRQRPNQPQRAPASAEIVYSGIPHDQPIPQWDIRESAAPLAQRPLGWERVEEPYIRSARQSVAPAPYGYSAERPLYEEQRLGEPSVQYIRRAVSPSGYAPTAYGHNEGQVFRSATYSATQPTYREVSAYPREGRASVRPYPGRGRSRSPVMVSPREPTMAPPAPPPSRIIVDQFGREYIEPAPPSTLGRQSVMPSTRLREPEVIYERPVRSSSRMPGADVYEENGVIYRRTSPAMPARRVITQPGYGIAEHRGYRDRDYSMHPVGSPGHEFIQYRSAVERRAPEEAPQGYITRATTARPAEPHPYYARPTSIRPEAQAPPRQYASSVHPEARREGMMPGAREYSVRPPVETEVPRREYSVRPMERYYERAAPRDEEVIFMERPPPGHHEIVYAEDGRPVYQ